MSACVSCVFWCKITPVPIPGVYLVTPECGRGGMSGPDGRGITSLSVSEGEGDGPWPLNSTGRHGLVLKSTCDMEPSDMRNEISDTITIRPTPFLPGLSSNRHATLGYFKIDRIITKIVTVDIIHFLKSPRDILGLRQGPQRGVDILTWPLGRVGHVCHTVKGICGNKFSFRYNYYRKCVKFPPNPFSYASIGLYVRVRCIYLSQCLRGWRLAVVL